MAKALTGVSSVQEFPKGPSLDLIFINVNDIGASVRLLADDTSLYIVVESPQSAATILDSVMSTISNWAKFWLVAF